METDPGVKQRKEKMGFESTELSGRVIRALYDDPNLLTLSGKTIITAEAAERYGISDLDGTNRTLCVGSMAALILLLISNKNAAVLRQHRRRYQPSPASRITKKVHSGRVPCCVVSVTYVRTYCFHGANEGSNPSGDANEFNNFGAIW